MTRLVIRVQSAEQVPGVAVVTLGGPIDAKNVIDLERVIDGASQRGFRTFILDLDRVRYINSMGLSFLVNLADSLAVDGGALHLANVEPKVKIVLDLMGVSGYFKIHGSVAAALQRVAPRRKMSRSRA